MSKEGAVRNYAYHYEIPGAEMGDYAAVAWKIKHGFVDVWRFGAIQDVIGAAAPDISEDDLVAAFAPMLTLPAPGELYYLKLLSLPIPRMITIYSDDPRLKAQRDTHGGSVWDLSVTERPGEMDVRELRALADTAERELEVLADYYNCKPEVMSRSFCERIRKALSKRPEDPTLRKLYDRACEIRAKHRTPGREW